MNNTKVSIGGCLVSAFVVLLVLVGFGAVLVNTQVVKAETAHAQATAQAELLARSTPISEQSIVAIQGMDDIVKVAESGFSSNVAIAASGDAAQASMSMFWCASSWALPAGLVAFAVILWLLKGGKKNEE